MAQMIANPEGVLMPMNTVQGGFESPWSYCDKVIDSWGNPAGHRLDGINYPTPSGDCPACIYEAAGIPPLIAGLPIAIPDGDPSTFALARTSQPAAAQGTTPLYG